MRCIFASFVPSQSILALFVLGALRLVLACPSGYYLSPQGASCIQCEACLAPFSPILPCGPGSSPGLCGSGLRVALAINGTGGVSLNATLTLANVSALVSRSWDASALLVEPNPCLASQYRSDLDTMCHACRVCQPPLPVEVGPCSIRSDRVCAPPLVVQFQAQATRDAALDPRSAGLAALLASSSRNNFSAGLTQSVYDRVSVAKMPCPTGRFRSDTDGLCHPCKTCPPLVDEAVPCATDTDRACGTSLVVGFRAEGVALLTQHDVEFPAVAHFDQSAREDVDVVVVQTPCVPGQFRALDDQLCHACTLCRPGESELRGCGLDHDRWCAGSVRISLDVLGAAGVDTASLDLTSLQARLEQALALSQPFPIALPLPYAQREHHTLTVAPLPCPPGAYIDTGALVCRACSVCASSQYELAPCALDGDTRCANCTVCGPFDTTLRECGPRFDRVCTGALELRVYAANASRLDQSLLNHTLLGPLLKALPAGASVDADYLRHWSALFSSLTGDAIGYDIEATAINCSDGEYLDLRANRCAPCSVCPSTAYSVQQCTNQSDAVCAECNVCGPGQYEACPCGGQPAPESRCLDANRICYAYASFNATVQATLLSQYDAGVLIGEYLPTALAFVRSRTLAPYAEIRVDESAPFSSPVVAYKDGSLGVTLDTTRTQRLFSIPGYPVALGGLVAHTVTLTLGGLFAQRPNDALDFTGLLERALYHADSALVPGAPDSLVVRAFNDSADAGNTSLRRLFQLADSDQAGNTNPRRAREATDQTGNTSLRRPRRLFQLADQAVFCPADTYPGVYPFFGQYCTPCEDDPVVTADASTPPALRWALADQPCPPSYARKCYGGTAPPMCIARMPAALILTSSSWPVVPLGCPTGQEYAAEPTTGYLICVGTPCGPGQYGPDGYCKPCAQGYYKATTGPGACTPCPAGTYGFLPGQGDAAGCEPCPLNTWSQPGQQLCACNAGYAGDVPFGYMPAQSAPCAPCGAGTYKLVWGTAPCSPCYPGGRSAGLINRQCAVCLPGTYASAFGQSACAACAPGAFQNLLAATGCRLCERGYASLLYPPFTYCVGCLAGAYAPEQGLSACLACPRGSYSFARASACGACPNGTEVASQACPPCLPGAACPPCATGASCVPCLPGSAGLGGVCDPCPPETYAPSPAGTACQGCAAGTYSTSIARTACDPCPPGHTGLLCLACSPGLYATGLAQTTCFRCARGLYSSAPGATSAQQCQPCQQGAYWAEQGCLACPANTLAPLAALSQRDCLAAPGYFGPPGQAAQTCPVDHYCPRAAMTPVRCPDGAVAAQGSEVCLVPPVPSTLRQYDWLVLSSWFVASFLGVAFVVRSRRFWRSPRRPRLSGVGWRERVAR